MILMLRTLPQGAEIMNPALVKVFPVALAAVAAATMAHAQQGGPATKTFDRRRYE